MSDKPQVRTRLLNLKTFCLEHYTIGLMPPYVAVSHVWSENLFPPKFQDYAKAPGMRMVLNTIAQSDRLPEDTYCWTDTWCVDQNDPADKARQIPMMGTIYQNATAVLITIDHVFSFTQEDWGSVMLTLKKATALIQIEHEWDTDEALRYYKSPPISNGIEQAISMLVELAERPWFTRVWTVQEYVLGKEHIWIGSNLQPLCLKPTDIDALFSLWNQRHRGELYETANDIEDPLYKTLKTLYTMNTVRSGSLDPTSIMQLAADHACFFVEDKIYGLMAAAGIPIPYVQGSHIDGVWKQWWQEAIRRGHPFLAMLPTSTKSSAAAAPFSGNCIMPHASIRCEAISENYLDVYNPLTPAVLDDSGMMEMSGRMVGKVTISKYLGSFTSDIDLLREVALVTSGNEALLKTLARALTSGDESFQDIATWAKYQHAHYHSWIPGVSLLKDEYVPLQGAEESFASLEVNKPTAGRLFLAKVKNYLKETDIIVVADSFPSTGELLALDVNAKLGYGGYDPRVILMIVQAPEGLVYAEGNLYKGYTDTILHKVGTTFPVFFPENESIVLATEFGGHVHHPVEGHLERFKIGGQACEGCIAKRKGGDADNHDTPLVTFPGEIQRLGDAFWQDRPNNR